MKYRQNLHHSKFSTFQADILALLELFKKSTAAIHLKPCIICQYILLPELALLPGLARSSLAVQNSCRSPGLVHHVMCATAYVTTILMESMISQMSQHTVQRSKRPPEITVMVCVQTYVSAKGLGSERAQDAIFSLIIDIYIQIPWPHRVSRLNLDSISSSSSS